MKKRFNTTGSCNPAMHYMVDTSKKLAQIEEYIDDGLYFTINRARQFGKTTTLKALFRNLLRLYVMSGKTICQNSGAKSLTKMRKQ
jgi:hypothetical protein